MHFKIHCRHEDGKPNAEMADVFRKDCAALGINHGEQTIVILQTTHCLVIMDLDYYEISKNARKFWLEYAPSSIILCMRNEYLPEAVVRYVIEYCPAENMLLACARTLSGISNLNYPLSS